MDFGRSFSSSPVITSYSSSLKTQWNMISIYYYILPGKNRSWSTTHTKMRRTMLCPRTHKSNVHTVNPPTCWVIHEGKGEEVSKPCVGNKHDNKTERKKGQIHIPSVFPTRLCFILSLCCSLGDQNSVFCFFYKRNECISIEMQKENFQHTHSWDFIWTSPVINLFQLCQCLKH